MYVICAICQEGLDTMPPCTTPNLKDRICTITCGHIFHVSCVNEWWRQIIRRARRDVTEGEGENIKFSCAVCRRQMKEPLVFEVFPSSMEPSDDSDDEDLATNAVEDKNLPVLELKIAKLEAIIANKAKKVDKLKTELKAIINSDAMDVDNRTGDVIGPEEERGREDMQ